MKLTNNYNAKLKLKNTEMKHHRLITNISHNLKNALTVLKVYLDLLRNNSIESEADKADFILSSYNKCCQLQVFI